MLRIGIQTLWHHVTVNITTIPNNTACQHSIDGPDPGDVRICCGTSGRVEGFFTGIWQRVASTGMTWTSANSRVVCGEAGYLKQG